MKSSKNVSERPVSRRNFLASTAKTAVGLTILPSHVISGFGHVPPSDKLNIAGIGIGGKGKQNLGNIVKQNIVGLCDIDWKYAKPVFEKYPKAKKWKDYRKMLDKQKDIDACVIATPDHTHALPAKIAMEQGKHVYLQKPLTHSIWESRELMKIANKTKVATQMGNEGHSSDRVREVAEYIRSGAIGEIKEVHLWTDRPISWWPQGRERPTEKPQEPDTLDWNLFIGPSKWCPYHPIYTPFNWRGWWDWGTGALGDMGCHVFDIAVYALKLQTPQSVQASSTPVYTESAPLASRVEYTFKPGPYMPGLSTSEIKLVWYDGGLLPSRPKELPVDEKLGNNIFIGTKGKIVCGTYGSNIKLLPLDKDFETPPKTLKRISDSPLGGGRHEMDWVRACKESSETRKETASNFNVACPLNESVLLGNLAIRLQDLNRPLQWDNKNMSITNIQKGETIRTLKAREYKPITPGNFGSNDEWQKINALESAREWIKHTYREGWNWE